MFCTATTAHAHGATGLVVGSNTSGGGERNYDKSPQRHSEAAFLCSKVHPFSDPPRGNGEAVGTASLEFRGGGASANNKNSNNNKKKKNYNNKYYNDKKKKKNDHVLVFVKKKLKKNKKKTKRKNIKVRKKKKKMHINNINNKFRGLQGSRAASSVRRKGGVSRPPHQR